MGILHAILHVPMTRENMDEQGLRFVNRKLLCYLFIGRYAFLVIGIIESNDIFIFNVIFCLEEEA